MSTNPLLLLAAAIGGVLYVKHKKATAPVARVAAPSAIVAATAAAAAVEPISQPTGAARSYRASSGSLTGTSFDSHTLWSYGPGSLK